MKDFEYRAAQSRGASLARIFALGFGPRPVLDPETGTGTPAPTTPPATPPAPTPTPAPEPSAKPSDAEAELLKEVMDKKKKLAAAEKERDDAAVKLKSFEGVNLEEYAALKAAKVEADKKQAEAAQDWDKLKGMMASEHATQIAGKDKDLAEKDKAIAGKDKVIHDLLVDRAFTTSEYVKNDLVLPPLKARTVYGDRIGILDGAVVGYDKPGGTVLVGADGKPLAFDEVVKRMVEADADAEKIKKSKLNPGSGANPANVKRPEDQGSGKNELRGVNRIKSILKATKA